MKIVVFGLTGDPVTSAHMEIITRLSESFDKVIVAPTNVNYYKSYKGHDRAMFSFAERYDNLVAKCDGLSNVFVSDIERDISNGWRFFNTLTSIISKELSNVHPNFNINSYEDDFTDKFYAGKLRDKLSQLGYEFFVAIGSDSLQNFKTWYNWQEINTIARLVVFNRPGFTDNFPEDVDYQYLDMNNDVSSTKIRKNLIAFMSKFENNLENEDFDTWIDDVSWAKGYYENELDRR